MESWLTNVSVVERLAAGWHPAAWLAVLICPGRLRDAPVVFYSTAANGYLNRSI
jgi:hypothetical protein